MLAASKGHEAAMKVLLQKGADLTVQDQVSERVSECCFSCADVCECVCVWLVSVGWVDSAQVGG
jgi:chloramphenicol 3-O-phosphotransferase